MLEELRSFYLNKNASNKGVSSLSDSMNCATYCDQTAARTNSKWEETDIFIAFDAWELVSLTQLRTAADYFISCLIVKPIVFTVCLCVQRK